MKKVNSQIRKYNYGYFYEWANVIPFFANIEKEGVDIIG